MCFAWRICCVNVEFLDTRTGNWMAVENKGFELLRIMHRDYSEYNRIAIRILAASTISSAVVHSLIVMFSSISTCWNGEEKESFTD